jgi:hypothetical protein
MRSIFIAAVQKKLEMPRRSMHIDFRRSNAVLLRTTQVTRKV